jgi:hypothetical protein
MHRALVLSVFGLLSASGPAGAGLGHAGEISHGDVEFGRTAASWDGSPEAVLTGVTAGGQDQLFGHGWWYRLAGQSLETPFPMPTDSLYGGNESSIDWENVAGAFDAHEAASVFDAGTAGNPGDGGYVSFFLTITNTSPAFSLGMHLFHYADFDLTPTNNDDTASWVEWRSLIEVYDAPISAGYRAFQPANHQVGAHPAIVNLLNDGVANNLLNTGTPFGPGDFSAANQWILSIPPNGSVEVQVILAVNTPLRCGAALNDGIFCDGFESNNRSFWLSVPP